MSIKKNSKAAYSSKTIIIAVVTFVIGLITFLTGSDLWGMIPGESNVTEIVIMIQSGLMFVLRFLTDSPISFKK